MYNFKSVREDKNISQADVAKSLNVTQSYISLIESGRKDPPFRFAEEMADLYGVPMDRFRENKGRGDLN